MKDSLILKYFEEQAKLGIWDELYNPNNPLSHSFIHRFNKSINLIEDLNGKKICDLGCGTGILIPFVLYSNGKYTGVDNSKEMINVINKKFFKELETKAIDLKSCDLRDLNINEKFDVIFGLGFIEYFDNPDSILEKIDSLLNNNGQVILSFPNLLSLDYFMVKAFYILKYLFRIMFNKKTNTPPRNMWTVDSAKKMFERKGFKNIKIINYNTNLFVYPFTRIIPKFSNFFGNFFENSFLSRISFFSTGFIISAKK